jgi:ElaB/YqjD/DUF883 family membrane-anchored ribosome-binding protein
VVGDRGVDEREEDDETPERWVGGGEIRAVAAVPRVRGGFGRRGRGGWVEGDRSPERMARPPESVEISPVGHVPWSHGERKGAMSGTKKTAEVEVEEKIEQAAGDGKEAAESVAEERAKEALGEGYGKLRTRSADTYEKAKQYMAEARVALENAREKMGELYGRTRERVEEAYSKSKAQYDKLAAEVKKGYAAIRAKVEEVDVKEVRDDVIEYIRRNPGKSVLIALGVGFAVGFLLRKREP